MRSGGLTSSVAHEEAAPFAHAPDVTLPPVLVLKRLCTLKQGWEFCILMYRPGEEQSPETIIGNFVLIQSH